MPVALLVLTATSVTLAFVALVLSALEGGGSPGLLIRAVIVMLVVEQGTLTILALRVPALAILRPVVLIGAATTSAGALFALGAVASGAADGLGSIRWIVAVGSVFLLAQCGVTFAMRDSFRPDRATSGPPKPIS